MSDEERRDSLADQAAAWVPPWQRPTPPQPAPEDLPTQREPEDTADPGTQVPLQGHSGSTIPESSVDEQSDVGQSDVGQSSVEQSDVGQRAVGQSDAEQRDAGESGVGRRPGVRVRVVPEPPPVLDDTQLRGALEAILLVVDEPVSELILAQVLEQPAERVGPMLDEIAAGYTAAGHGFELRRAAGGWRLYTRPEYATYVERFVLDGQSVRLTQAALETLAVVAYKQPVTRSRISAIRGVNCDGVIRTLVSRGLAEECGTETDSGAYLYRTTTMFLEKLGLNSLDDLPPLAPFLPDDVEELADATR
ncbi:segregation and condensation protein B [Micromonospora phaseoli]|uniref:Segregation and condensation protein B n=1 Tax=Micromonospora phaseoli TaxID=1144548 RepID=A0A1H7DVJ0_9ACTN|nr:SMC-Scp complex subunit ScpB [Micromonospora phaseoli]PZV89938.1 segregation and condensation protein B [Micromonospora phaseoli]GIJ81117.1 hypothetical protein Xph01_55490 [Micromonospora phaseoli]SEK05751.1 segregation and condensation protein B [Micromonospora phaseoli]